MTGISYSIADTSARLRNRWVLLPRPLRRLEAVPCCTARDKSHRLPKHAVQRTSCLSLKLSSGSAFCMCSVCRHITSHPSKRQADRPPTGLVGVAIRPRPRASAVPRVLTPGLELPPSLSCVSVTQRQIHDRLSRCRRIGTRWHKRIAA